MASKVYFTNMRTYNAESLPEKITRLIKTAGIGEIDFKNKFTAVKVHFGEAGNLAYLRPNYAKAVVDVLKELGAKPFVTDCSTLYVGARKNARYAFEQAKKGGSNSACLVAADGTVVSLVSYLTKNEDGENVSKIDKLSARTGLSVELLRRIVEHVVKR